MSPSLGSSARVLVFGLRPLPGAGWSSVHLAGSCHDVYLRLRACKRNLTASPLYNFERIAGLLVFVSSAQFFGPCLCTLSMSSLVVFFMKLHFTTL